MPMLLSGDCDAELLTVLQHFCLLVPPARRRQLQILLRYLGKMSTNPRLVLHDRFTNKQQACLLFSICLSDKLLLYMQCSFPPHFLSSTRAPERFQARVGKHFLEKIWRKVSKIFSRFVHPGFLFAHPGFNKMGGQRPSCDYLNTSLLKSSLLLLLSLSCSA